MFKPGEDIILYYTGIFALSLLNISDPAGCEDSLKNYSFDHLISKRKRMDDNLRTGFNVP
jgi:hypothetical protein